MFITLVQKEIKNCFDDIELLSEEFIINVNHLIKIKKYSRKNPERYYLDFELINGSTIIYFKREDEMLKYFDLMQKQLCTSTFTILS